MSVTITFEENPSVKLRNQPYETIKVDLEKVLKSWKASLYSFEWLDQDGKIKPVAALKEADQERRRQIEARIEKGMPLEMPILGIGMLDNVEIGVGKAVLLTAAAMGTKTMPVHVASVHLDDFKAYIVAR
ncbi:MAG: hypothetical protein QF692_03005 [Alphaproteobacteria bacterium]|jgi:hypothetical protein|nr:hypothetical protein [Alphaproteobacteria bacterium]MDP7222212.1 hypothetical protein [Alphaproteobacteria bacterium]